MASLRLKSILGSLAVKLGLVIALLGGAAVAAIATALIVFDDVTVSVDDAIGSVLPRMEASQSVIELGGKTGDAVAALGLASSEADRAVLYQEYRMLLTALIAATESMSPSAAARIRPAIDDLGGTVMEMNSALSRRFEAGADMTNQLMTLQALVNDLSAALTQQKDAAQAALQSGSEQTVESVQSALNSIAGTELDRLRNLLEARAELGIVIGASLAKAGTTNPELAEQFTSLARSSLFRFNRSRKTFGEDPFLQNGVVFLQDVSDVVQSAIDADFLATLSLREELLVAFNTSDTWLLDVIDRLTTSLTFLASDVGERNAETVDSLIKTEVGALTDAQNLDVVFKDVVIKSLIAASTEDVTELDAIKQDLGSTMFKMYTILQWGTFPEEMSETIKQIGAINDEETGVVAVRKNYLAAVEELSTITRVAFASVDEIAQIAGEESRQSAADMKVAGGIILEKSAGAKERLMHIAGVVLGAGVLGMLVSWAFVVRPLRRITRETERLASGDDDPVVGFERTGGEIGKMAQALSVFRDGMVERQEMRKQEALREEQQRADELRAVEEKRAAEKLEAEREAERIAEERRLEEERREREAAAEAKAKHERETLAREQELVVTALANGMRSLSQGDLTVSIQEAFPSAYESLRLDFNDAVITLSSLIQRISESASNVNDSSLDMASTANNMAHRTERSAAALEQTSAAVLELEATAKSTSSAASEVNAVMTNARSQAESSRSTVTNAVTTMSEIEESSTAISKIVDMIEEIAFQTNLLALNAGVEAARAGEEGRGFGVVASEVRALAQRSSDAASEINDLITKTRNQISNGVSQVGNAGDALNGILSLISDISDHVSGITNAAQEQSTTISEISGSVSKLEEETQRSAAVFEESLAASELLSSEAAVMTKLAESFSTSKQDKSSHDAADVA